MQPATETSGDPAAGQVGPDTRDLRIGAVGFGARGRLARLAHRPGNGAEVVAVCDPAEAARQRAVDKIGPSVATCATVGQLLAYQLDAVLVLSPDDSHEDIVCELLAAGIATYVEKPLAITVAGCDRILRAARDNAAPLYVGHNMRHVPVIRKMRELIVRGDIGEVKAVWCRHFVGHGGDYYFKDWHADRRRTTSLLLQKGVHDIDVIHWLAGGYTRRVTAMGGLTVYGQITSRRENSDRTYDDFYSLANWPPLAQRELNPVLDVEDLSMATMALDNGVFATYEQCHYTPDYWRNYTVIGTEGRLENFGDLIDAEIRVWNRRTDYKAAGDVRQVLPAGPRRGHGGADDSILNEFFDLVRTGTVANITPVAARESVAVACLATESLRGGGGVRGVPPLDPDLAAYFVRGRQL